MSFRWSLFSLMVVLGIAQLAPAEGDFAIKTQILSGDDEAVVAENLTVFHDGKVYDFALTDPQSVTMFDTKTRRFLLTEPTRRVKTSLSANELIRFAADEQARAQNSKNQLVRFAADPKFDESYDPESGRLSLTSIHWDYHVETRSIDDADVLKRYSEFANWFTHLNALFRPLPSATRLELNRVLDQHRRLPDRVVVHIKQDGKTVVSQQSRHELITELSGKQLDRVSDWDEQRATYRTVDFLDYRAARGE